MDPLSINTLTTIAKYNGSSEPIYSSNKEYIGDILIPFSGFYRPHSPRDHQNARIVIEFIDNNADAFERNACYGHVTGSSFVLDQSRRHVLLTHHSKLDTWLPLGGHCDGIRDTRFVALKEAYEESGLRSLSMLQQYIFDIDIHEIPEYGGTPSHFHFDIRYLLEANISETLHVSHESQALSWVPIDELESFTDKSSVLILEKKLDFL